MEPRTTSEPNVRQAVPFFTVKDFEFGIAEGPVYSEQTQGSP